MDDIYYDQDRLPKVDPEIIRRLSVLKPWRSLAAIFLDWFIIVLCIVLCVHVSYWFYPLAFVIIGTRFHGLEAMMHEATHYRLHPNRKINDFIGELAVWPLGISLFLYRKLRHFAHHKSIGTVRDSHVLFYRKDFDRYDIPKTLWPLVKNCLIVATRFPGEVWLGQIYTTGRLLPVFSKRLGILWIAFQICTWLGVVIGSLIYGWKILGMYLLFFVAPLIWIAVFSRYLRLITEHFGIPVNGLNQIPGGETRTVLVSWPVRVLFWPHNLNYHIEHHWYPSVPFYNLPTLHRILQDLPLAKQRMHITRGIRNLIRELTGSLPHEKEQHIISVTNSK